MMRKTLIGLIVTACFGALDVANAAYVIKLKNGNEYVTARYWHEGTQILFDTYGGIFGIDKAFVGKIEETDRVIRVATAADRDPAEKSPADAPKQTSDQPTTNQEAGKKARAPDDPIIGELNQLKARSKEIDGMLATEIRELLNEITAFKNRLVKNHKLFIDYGREFNDLQELGSTVETTLRSRTH